MGKAYRSLAKRSNDAIEIRLKMSAPGQKDKTSEVDDGRRRASLLFGPIPSRRLGRSLGINNIPPKMCSYSCTYCQIGRTGSLSLRRSSYFTPGRISEEVASKINELRRAREKIDYLTFVPDGEPTLDINLGKTIDKLKSFGIKIAVITNASLIWDPNVRRDLMNADWVSLKFDAPDEATWRRINRPHGSLRLQAIWEGAIRFAQDFKGTLVTETMLVRGVNDTIAPMARTAIFIKQLSPKKSYILVPTRPPAEQWVARPNERTLNAVFQIFSHEIQNVELLIRDEGTDFTYTSDAEKELLGILAVHPMSEEAVREFLAKAGRGPDMMDKLIADRAVKSVVYSGRRFFLKTLRSATRESLENP